MRRIILVCGYPKCGNTWLSRLLGEAYNSPVQGLPGQEDGSLATEGADRPGIFRVVQAHLIPKNYHGFTEREVSQAEIVLIVRHPLDVLVSAAFFWGIGIEQALDNMAHGNWPIADIPPFNQYYHDWLDSRKYHKLVTYEQLSGNAVGTLEELTGLRHLERVVYNQSFAVKKREIELHPERFSYDKKAQLHNLRRGTAGDWRNHLKGTLLNAALYHFDNIMKRLNYER